MMNHSTRTRSVMTMSSNGKSKGATRKEGSVRGGRDAVFVQKVFRKGLGAFQLGTGGAGSETGQTGIPEAIDNACDQRNLGADDRQTDAFVRCKFQQGLDVIRPDRDIARLRFACRAGIPRRNEDLMDAAGLCTFPCQCMFPSAAAYDQNLHRLI